MIAALAIMLGAWAIMAAAVVGFLAVMAVFGWYAAMAGTLFTTTVVAIGAQR